MGYQGLNIPKPRLPVTEGILSDQQQKVWATGIWPGQSRVKIYLIPACQVFSILRKHEYYGECACSSEGEERRDLTFLTNPPHHRLLCLSLEGLHIFHPDGSVIPDYHFMSAGETREGPHVVYCTEKPEAA